MSGAKARMQIQISWEGSHSRVKEMRDGPRIGKVGGDRWALCVSAGQKSRAGRVCSLLLPHLFGKRKRSFETEDLNSRNRPSCLLMVRVRFLGLDVPVSNERRHALAPEALPVFTGLANSHFARSRAQVAVIERLVTEIGGIGGYPSPKTAMETFA